MERKMLAYPRWNLSCSRLQASISIGLPSDRANRGDGYLGWNQLKSRATSDGVHTAVIFMLVFPLGYPQMEPTEEMSCLGWNLPKTWVTSDGIHSATTYIISRYCATSRWSLHMRWASLDGIKTEMKTIAAAMDGMGICSIWY
jgi:hypothetical protein